MADGGACQNNLCGYSLKRVLLIHKEWGNACPESFSVYYLNVTLPSISP